MSRGHCWPGAWLQRDLPSARLLTVEYAAPASNWEVGNHGCVRPREGLWTPAVHALSAPMLHL